MMFKTVEFLSARRRSIQVHGRLRTDPDALTLLSGVSLEEGDVGTDQNTEVSPFRVWLGGGGHEKAERLRLYQE